MLIHHDRATSEWMDEEDGFDLIETSDGFTVYRRDYCEGTFQTLEEATAAMYELLEHADARHEAQGAC